MNYKYLFGPVPSRRLGISLGIDLVPYKTCTLDCVYCECGQTSSLTTIRKEYVPTDEILAELDSFLKTNPKLDYITFSGSGEPTLHSGIGKITNFIKDKYPYYKTALLTNSSLLFKKEVQTDIMKIDLILPSLDAVSEEVFQYINRACSDISNKQIIDGLIKFSNIYKGKIWLEIFIIPGINDSIAELTKFKEILFIINPDKIQLNSLDRPGAVEDTKKATREEMENIVKFLLPLKSEIIAKYKTNIKSQIIDENSYEKIISTIKRRPCTIEDLLNITGLSNDEIINILNTLINKNKIIKSKQDRGLFYQIVE